MRGHKNYSFNTDYSRVPSVNRQADWVAELDRFIASGKQQLERLGGFVFRSPHSSKIAIGVAAVALVVLKLQEEDKGMSSPHKKRVLLSFAYEDIAQVNGLRGLIQNPNHELEAYDESVREPIESHNSEYVKRRIREKIRRSSVTVCLINAITHQSKWVEWELEESVKQGNTIIAMALKGVGKASLPSLIQQRAIKFYGWNPSLLDRLIETAT